MAVLVDDAYANIVLPAIVRRGDLDSRDAALTTELTYGSLRMRGLYDAIIAKASGRPAETLEDGVRACLWLGAHQVLSMRIPAHAAVGETVSLVKDVGLGRASGLVNAVMRRISEASLDVWMMRVAPRRDRASLAVRTSHPAWVVGELEAALRADGRAGQIEDLLAAHNVPPQVTLVARPGLITREQLAAEVGGLPTLLSPWGVTLGSGDPGRITSVRDGRAAVQDEGSQLAALALAEADVVGRDLEWLDMCSGPGGKAALLGALAAQRGARLDALELHGHRARLVNRATRALPDGVVTVHTADASTWTHAGGYDRILLDAPCTGLGAMRRRPESRWRRSPEDLADLTALQQRLLRHAATLLRPGGVLAYVTCSPVLGETRDHLRDASWEILDARPVLARLTGVGGANPDVSDGPDSAGAPGPWGASGAVQLWTHVHGTDSMFIALARRPI